MFQRLFGKLLGALILPRREPFAHQARKTLQRLRVSEDTADWNSPSLRYPTQYSFVLTRNELLPRCYVHSHVKTSRQGAQQKTKIQCRYFLRVNKISNINPVINNICRRSFRINDQAFTFFLTSSQKGPSVFRPAWLTVHRLWFPLPKVEIEPLALMLRI